MPLHTPSENRQSFLTKGQRQLLLVPAHPGLPLQSGRLADIFVSYAREDIERAAMTLNPLAARNSPILARALGRKVAR